MPEDSGDRRPFDPLAVIAGPAGLGHGWLQLAQAGSMPQMPGTLGAPATGHWARGMPLLVPMPPAALLIRHL